jgi:hypothetical protein
MGKRGSDEFWERLPGEALRGLDRWLRGQPFRIEPVEWLGGGNSGSPIAVVARYDGGFDDKVAIKFFARDSEVSKWQAAISETRKKFRKRHLVGIDRPSPLGREDNSWWMAVLKIAGGDLSSIRPLAELSPHTGPAFADACQSVVSSIIAKWNPRPLPHPSEEMTVNRYLTSIFDSSRVTTGKPLYQWLDSTHIDLHDPLVRRPNWTGRLPNPLAFAANADELHAAGRLRVRYGRAHGDLHLGNILMKIKPPEPGKYQLIDLGQYASKSPLARDPMHFLLSIALEWLNDGVEAGSKLSHSLIEALVGEGDQETAKSYREVSQAIHKVGYNWAAEKGWGDDWTRQSLLSLVGCALRYASRQIPGIADASATRGWFFDAAAVAARAYLAHVGLWEYYGEEFAYQRPAPSALPPPAGPRRAEHQSGNALPDSKKDVPEAKVYHFPTSAERQDDAGGTATTASPANAQGTWQDFTGALREVSFDGSDWRTLAASTVPLQRQLALDRPPHPISDEDISEHLTDLKNTLTIVLSHAAASAEVRSACAHAKLLRQWLLDLLAEPGQ